MRYFNGLLSERRIPNKRRGGWTWEIIPGHTRNEALDCRNYALAAFWVLNPDMDAEERRLKGLTNPQKQKPQTSYSKPRKRKDLYDEW